MYVSLVDENANIAVVGSKLIMNFIIIIQILIIQKLKLIVFEILFICLIENSDIPKRYLIKFHCTKQ